MQDNQFNIYILKKIKIEYILFYINKNIIIRIYTI